MPSLFKVPLRVLFVGLWLVVMTAVTLAQEQGRSIQFALTILPGVEGAAGGGLSGLAFPMEGGDWQVIPSIPVLSPSKTYSWNTSRDLLLYKRAGQGPDGEIRWKESAKVVFPEKGNVFLLIVAPQNADGFYPVMSIRDDREAMPDGSVHLVNLARREIACRIGKQFVRIVPGGQQSVDLGLDGPQMTQIEFAALIESKGEWIRTWSSLLPMYPGQRTIILIPPGQEGGRSHYAPWLIRDR